MASTVDIHRGNGNGTLRGITLANVDLADRKLVAALRERDLDEGETRIKNAVQRLHDLGIDASGRRTSQELPSDMRADSPLTVVADSPNSRREDFGFNSLGCPFDP
jgi:hypothetical protein